MDNDRRYVINGVGMVTSLGLDAPTSCAAARAGLSRAAPLEYFTLKGPDGDVLGITGHCVSLLTNGFEGYARLLRLAQGGLEDLRRDLGGVVPKRAAFYVSIPHPHRRFGGLRLIADDQLRADYERALQDAGEATPAKTIAKQLLAQAAGLAGWDEEFELRYVDTTGHAGVARALNAAVAELASGRVGTAVVGGVDSLMGERILQWLDDTGRLKTPTVAAGLQPGEAGAFVVLNCEQASSSRARFLAVLQGLQFGAETHPLLSGEPPQGDGLAQVLMAIAALAAWDRDTAPWVVSDQNGELYRAYDWGHACTRLRSAYGGMAQGALWHPVEAFGDTGAASGAVSLIVATSAFRRHCAPAESATLLSSSDGPERAAIRVGGVLH